MLTNRVNTVKIGNQKNPKNFINSKCFYTAYQVMIDWNGNFYLCPQDWQRKISLGNLMESKFFDIWNGKKINNYRSKLLKGDRSNSPCNECNAHGESRRKVYEAWLSNK